MTCSWCSGPHATEACALGRPLWLDLPLGFYTLLDGHSRERVELIAVEVIASMRWSFWRDAVASLRLGPVTLTGSVRVEPEPRVTVLLRYQTPALPGRTLTTSPLVWGARKPIYLGASYRKREPLAGEVLA